MSGRAMKDSGIEWIGEIPEHWEVTKWKYLSSWITYGFTRPMSHVDEGIYIVTAANIINGKIDFSTAKQTTFKEFQLLSSKDRPQKGDILITKDGSIGRSAIVNTNALFCISQSVAVLFFKELDRSKEFLNFIINSDFTQKRIELVAQGGAIKHLSITDFGNMKVPLPPLSEQRAIATFLDRKTSQIDQIIEKKERLIKLLEEKRSALITQAVTRGLDPDVPMKDSGIEWIGEIPEHWSIKALKSLFYIKGGVGFPDIYQGELGFDLPFYKVNVLSKCSRYIEREHASDTVSEDVARRLRASVFIRDNIVFAKVGAALLLKRYRLLTQKSCIDNNMMSLSIKGLDLPVYFVDTLPLIPLEAFVNPGAVPSISGNQFGTFKVPLPPLSEQRAIATFLDEKTSQIDQIIEKSKAQIEKLKEYRQALITAAVTGKIDLSETQSEADSNTANPPEQLSLFDFPSSSTGDAP